MERRQLVAVGLSAAAIDHRVRAGRLVLIHRGVYAVGHAALSDRGRLRAALMATGPASVLSHRTAAALWRLTPSMPPFVEVTIRDGRRRPRPGLVVHATSDRPDTRTRGGFPVTAPLRTLTDLTASGDRDRLCREALVLELVTERQLERARLTGPEIAPTRSEVERRFLALMRQAGLPKPLVNHPIGRYTGDFVWPDALLVVETDGWGSHGHRAAFEHDHRRDALLESLGWHVLRFTWRQLRDAPLHVVAVVAQVLSRRSPRPPGRAAA